MGVNGYFRTKIMLFIVVLLVFGSSYMYHSRVLASNCGIQADPVAIVTEEIQQENIKYKYPKIVDLADEKVQDKLNERIVKEVEDFEEQINQEGYSGELTYSIEYNKNDIVSIRFVEYSYRKRAAHPMHYMKALTMNTITGQEYQLSDVFKENSEYQARLNAIMNQEIDDKGLVLLKPFKGVGTNQEFYLTNDSIVVYYQLYDYTPYVHGFLTFTISLAQISDIVEEGFKQ